MERLILSQPLGSSETCLSLEKRVTYDFILFPSAVERGALFRPGTGSSAAETLMLLSNQKLNIRILALSRFLN